MLDDDGTAAAAVMKAIYDEIPAKIGIRAILLDAHARLVPVCRPELLPAKIAEVLREIATYAVEQFTKRTGEPFEWTDEPEWQPDGENVIMSFALDAKGNVVFGDGNNG
jgi:hypothetical protein